MPSGDYKYQFSYFSVFGPMFRVKINEKRQVPAGPLLIEVSGNMPSLPDTDETINEAQGALADGVVYGLGTGLGRSVLGGVGHAAGGVLAGASVGGQKGATLSTLAVAEGFRATFLAGGGGGSGRRTK